MRSRHSGNFGLWLVRHTLALSVAAAPLGALPGDPPFVRGPERVLFTWSGVVDRELWLTMRGGDLREGGIERWLPSRTRVLSPLPYGRGLVLVRIDGGRGYVEVMDQPGPWNGYAVTIRILDPRGGATGYRLTAFWDDGGRGPNRWHPLWDSRWDLPRWDPRWSDPRWNDPRWHDPRWSDPRWTPPRWDDRRWDDRRWDDRRGNDRPWDDRRGDDRRGEDRPGGVRRGDDRPGDDRRGNDQRGDDRRGNDQRDDPKRGDDRQGSGRRGAEPERRPDEPRRAQPRGRQEDRRSPEERPTDGRTPRPLVQPPPDTVRGG